MLYSKIGSKPQVVGDIRFLAVLWSTLFVRPVLCVGDIFGPHFQFPFSHKSWQLSEAEHPGNSCVSGEGSVV